MNNPNAKQKRWLELLSNHGCVVTQEKHNIQLHHVVGRSAKYNKLNIGHWWVLPLRIDLHDVHSNHPFNVTHNKKRFETEYGSQKDLFVQMISQITLGMAYGVYDYSVEDLPPKEVIDAIIEYRR